MTYQTLPGKSGGFSLIEVLVSLVILSVGLIGTAKLQTAVLKNGSDSQARSEAITIAQSKLEEFKSYETLADYDNIQSSAALISTAESQGQTLTFTVDGTSASYNINWSITENTTPNYLEVTVNVAWQDSMGSPQQVSIASIIGESEPSYSGLITL
jgi:type IV pilus modification protein PilV